MDSDLDFQMDFQVDFHAAKRRQNSDSRVFEFSGVKPSGIHSCVMRQMLREGHLKILL